MKKGSAKESETSKRKETSTGGVVRKVAGGARGEGLHMCIRNTVAAQVDFASASAELGFPTPRVGPPQPTPSFYPIEQWSTKKIRLGLGTE